MSSGELPHTSPMNPLGSWGQNPSFTQFLQGQGNQEKQQQQQPLNTSINNSTSIARTTDPSASLSAEQPYSNGIDNGIVDKGDTPLVDDVVNVNERKDITDNDTSAARSDRGRGKRGGARGGRGGAGRGKDDAAGAGGADSTAAGGVVEGEEGVRMKKKYDTPYQPVEKTDPPDERAYESKKESLESSVESIKKKIDALTSRIDDMKNSRQSARVQRQPLLEQLKLVRQQKTALFEEAKKYDGQIQAVKSSEKAAQQRIRDMKKELEFTDLQELDAYVAHVENTLSTTTVPPAQERLLIEKIRKLKKQRDAIVVYNSELQAIQSNPKVDTAEWEKERKRLNSEAVQYKEQEAELSKQLDSFTDTATSSNAEVEQAIEQRKSLIEQKNKVIEESRTLEREYNQQKYLYERWVKQEEYEARKKKREEERAEQKRLYEERKAERERKAAEAEQRRAEREARKKEREEMERAWREEQERIEASKDVWEEEKWIADEIINYLAKINPNAAPTEKTIDEEAILKRQQAELATERSSAFKGSSATPLVPFKAKEDTNDLFGAAAMQAKQKKLQLRQQSKAKGNAPASSSSSATTTDSRRNTGTKKLPTVLSHRPETMMWFNKIDIDPPHTLAAVPDVLEKVKAKREWYDTAPRELKTGKKSASKSHASASPATADATGPYTPPATAAETVADNESDALVDDTADQLAESVINAASTSSRGSAAAEDQSGPEHHHGSNSADVGRAGDISSFEESEIIKARVEAHNQHPNECLSAISDDHTSETADHQH